MKKGLIKNSFYHPEKKEIPFKGIILCSLVICIMSFIISAFFFYPDCIKETNAKGPSMNPTFDSRAVLYLNTTKTAVDSLTYHDIIEFNVNNEFMNKDFIKRIIALPGDYIETRDGKLFINNEYIEEDFIIPDNTPIKGQLLGEDEYFVMGDNRANSDDSRYTIIGVVHKSQIKGRVFGGRSELSSDTYNLIKFYK